MEKKHAEKLINLYKYGYVIHYLADTDDYYGWVVACEIDEEEFDISFDIVDFYVSLLDSNVNINNFKVYTEDKDWTKIEEGIFK